MNAITKTETETENPLGRLIKGFFSRLMVALYLPSVFQGMAKTLNGDMTGLKFQLNNARKDIRYYTKLAETVDVPTVHGDAVLSSLSIASALGHGEKFVPALVTAQETLANVTIVPK